MDNLHLSMYFIINFGALSYASGTVIILKLNGGAVKLRLRDVEIVLVFGETRLGLEGVLLVVAAPVSCSNVPEFATLAGSWNKRFCVVVFVFVTLMMKAEGLVCCTTDQKMEPPTLASVLGRYELPRFLLNIC